MRGADRQPPGTHEDARLSQLYQQVTEMQAPRFEADYHDPPLTYGWSVIVKGRAHVLASNADILDAEEAPLRSWIATLKPLFVRVIAAEITGRRFKFGPEPHHETIIG